MRPGFVRLASLLAVAWAAGRLGAQPLPPAYVPPSGGGLVMPAAGQPVPPLPPPALAYRPSAYRWQFYQRNYYGFLRPIVIQGPVGGYYLHNGVPFPWVHAYPGEHFMQLAPDSGNHP